MPSLRFVNIVFLFFLSFNFAQSQNLIPNAGFENVFAPGEHQWVQPQGPFYHYQKNTAHSMSAHTGDYFNGLCMYNNSPNEYLHIKLLEKLKKDSIYRFKTFIRLLDTKAQNYKLQDRIGIYFGNKLLNTQVPGDLPYDPQLVLFFPDSVNRMEWQELKGEYKAKGNEEFITIGFFPSLQQQIMKEKNKEEFWAELTRKYEEKEDNATSDKAWLYMPPDEQKKYLKEQRKKKKKVAHAEPPKPQMAAPKEHTDNPLEFIARYYFDDFCLSVVDSTGVSRCHSMDVEEDFVVGKTFTLKNIFFETAEDILLKESFIQLNELVNILQTHSTMKIRIEGHTDKEGRAEFNLDLSKRRAQSVINYLTQNGIEENRLQSNGFGYEKPIADNETEAGKALNRRVEFVIIEQ